MFNRCCIPGCGSYRGKVKLHKFPRKEIVLQKWLNSIDSDDFRKLSSEVLQKMFVCQKHFEKKSFSSSRFRSQSAYPTLFTKKEIDSGIPNTPSTQEDPEIRQLRADHDYTRKKKHVDHTYSKTIENILVEIERTANIECNSQSTTELNFKTCDNLTEPQILHPSDEFQSISELYESFGKIIKHIQAEKDEVKSNFEPYEYSDNMIEQFEHIQSEKDEDQCNLELYNNSENMIEHIITEKDEELSISEISENSGNMTEQMQSGTDDDQSMSELSDSSDNSIEYLEIVTDGEQSVSELDENEKNLIEYLKIPIDKTESYSPGSNIGTSNKHKEKRVVKKSKILTPRRLFKEYSNVKQCLTKRNMKVSKEKHFETLNKKLNLLSKKILYLQTKLHTKSKKVQRYPEDEKLIALSVMKQSRRVTKFCKEFLLSHQKAHR